MSPYDSDAPLLNEHQHRHFEVILATLEDTLVEVERLASGAPARSLHLTQYDDDLPPNLAANAQPALASARHDVARLTSQLRIRPRRLSIARSIRALLISEIVRLEDSTSRALAGYGEVNPRVARELEPALSDLRSALASIIDLLDGRTPPPIARP